MKKSFGDKKPGAWKDKKKPASGGFWQKNSHDSDAGRPEMYPSTCSDCGSDCMVPFKPNGRKPVLCSKCFNKDGNAYPNKPWERDAARSKEDRRMFPATCNDCGDRCQVPFRPAEGRPVYCQKCLGQGPASHPGSAAPAAAGGNDNDVAKQLKAINAKLDALIDALAGE